MSTVVVLSLTSSGHINPTLPLISELVRRGEQVTFYGIEQFRAIIENTGAEYKSYSHPEYLIPKTHQGEFFSVMAHFAKATQVNLPALLRELKQAPPDYILLDAMCIWGNLIQQILNVPAITFATTFVIPKQMPVEKLLDMVYLPRPKSVIYNGLKSLYEYFEIARKLDQDYGCKCPGLIEAFTSPQDLNLVYTAKEFHPQAEMFNSENYKFVGPSIAPRSEKFSFPFAKIDKQTTIYISLGTINNDHVDFYKQCFAAFGNRAERPYPHPVVLSIGTTVNPADLGDIPNNFIVMPKVPQLEILKRSSVFISHGGMNSTGEALYFGVPMLVIPFRGDQFLVAEQVSKNHAGLQLAPDAVTPSTLYDAVTEILASATFREGAAILSQAFQSAGGYIRAADEIMAYKQLIGLKQESIEEISA
jgi:MGT family glycosyltransferase